MNNGNNGCDQWGLLGICCAGTEGGLFNLKHQNIRFIIIIARIFEYFNLILFYEKI